MCYTMGCDLTVCPLSMAGSKAAGSTCVCGVLPAHTSPFAFASCVRQQSAPFQGCTYEVPLRVFVAPATCKHSCRSGATGWGPMAPRTHQPSVVALASASAPRSQCYPAAHLLVHMVVSFAMTHNSTTSPSVGLQQHPAQTQVQLEVFTHISCVSPCT